MSLHASMAAHHALSIEPGEDSYLRELDSAGWAWEWLRRNPEYRALFGSPRSRPEATASLSPGLDAEAARWGLHFRCGCESCSSRSADPVARRT